MNPPRITMYSRVLDNITMKEIESYKLVTPRSNFHFGRINGLYGGESSYVVEFDIWNNEMAFDSFDMAITVSDAINCTFSAWDNQSFRTANFIKSEDTLTPYVQARCVTPHYQDFQPIAGTLCFPSEKLFGFISTTPGLLKGQPGGDHFVVQTKIVLPSGVSPSVNNFVFGFQYNFI